MKKLILSMLICAGFFTFNPAAGLSDDNIGTLKPGYERTLSLPKEMYALLILKADFPDDGKHYIKFTNVSDHTYSFDMEGAFVNYFTLNPGDSFPSYNPGQYTLQTAYDDLSKTNEIKLEVH